MKPTEEFWKMAGVAVLMLGLTALLFGLGGCTVLEAYSFKIEAETKLIEAQSK